MTTIVSVLFGAVLGVSGTLLLTPGGPQPAATLAMLDQVVAAPAPAKPAAVRTVAASSSPEIPRCSSLAIPAQPSERVACRTPKALLQITGQARPLVVGGTNARVLSAVLSGSDVLVRMRVRNETRTEQGVQAGGQELYLNVAGTRVDAHVLSSVRVPPFSGRTVRLRYRLSMSEIAALREAGGAAELGVRPWDGSTVPGKVVGVIRMRVRTPATSLAPRPPS